MIDGVNVGDLAGMSSAGRGDINNDGFSDLVIGAFGAAPSIDRERAGQTLVLFGGPAHLGGLDLADGIQDGRIALALLNGTDGFTVNGVAAFDLAGTSSVAGDLNDDGVDDLVIGAPAGENKAYVVFGRDSSTGQGFPMTFELSTLDGSNGFVIPALPEVDLMLFGNVAGAGDVNHDGIGDLIVGAALADPSGRSGAGQAYVIFGRQSFPATFNLASLNGSNGFTVNGNLNSDFLGSAVAGGGDVNGDGIDDVLVHANGVDTPGGTFAGATFVIFGKTSPFPAVLEVSTLVGLNGFALRGIATNTASNSPPVSGAGDVNGDGYDDILIGSLYADPNILVDAGQGFLVYGGPSFGSSLDLATLLSSNGGDGSLGFALNGFVPGDRAGYVAGIGDINGDGYADVHIGQAGPTRTASQTPGRLTSSTAGPPRRGRPSSTWSMTPRQIGPTSTPPPVSPSRTTL